MCDIPIDLSRRRLVRLASLATGALTLGGVSTLLANEQDAVRRETADLITGPFYPRVKPTDTDADLTLVRGHHQRAAGQLVQLSGRVTNLKGEPLRNAPIEIWQANTHGRYSHPSDQTSSYRWRTHPHLIDRNVPRACGFASPTAASARRESLQLASANEDGWT